MSVVDEIKQKVDIVDLVSQTVKLRRSGRTYSGFCPFHQNTRTPAFYVFPETQTWHCFGACGMGGDIFTFTMKKENVDFGEALRMLAERAGVMLHRDPQEASNVKRLVEINQAAAAFFHYQLKHHAEAEGVRAYLEKRRIDASSVETFQIGYALNSYNALLEHLRAKGFSAPDIESAGLIVASEDGRVWDRFRGRLMFSIRNRRGEMIAFGGRALADAQQPKYLNSSDSPVFSKSDTLYGLDLAKDAIRAENLAIIVEGYTDVVIAHQTGFKNVVASLGTALTEKQLAQLSRLTKRYALALDADEAGAAATERGLNLARQALSYKNAPVPVGPGLIVFKERLDAELLILEMPLGRDPDEVILEDPETWRGLVAKAKPLLDYYLDLQTRDLDLNTAQGKSEYAKRLLPVIAQVKDGVQRAHYAQELARRMRSDERVVLDQLQTFEKGDAPLRVNKIAKELPTKPQAARYDEYLIALALHAPDLITRVEFVTGEDFEDPLLRQVWETLLRYNKTAVSFDADALMAQLGDETRATGERLREASKGIQFESGETARELEATGYRLRLRRCTGELTQLRFLLAETPPEEQVELAQRVSALSKWIAEAKRALDARSVLNTSVPRHL
ncbi:MAG: DNA primase [Chloroflexi bacterium]|nr:DNA primase [Chloroflexota bacterium]